MRRPASGRLNTRSTRRGAARPISAALGLSLAAVGIAGVLGYAVKSRTREIGLRRALGATPTRIVSELMAGVLGATTLGLIAGLVAAAFLTRFLARPENR